MDGTETRRCSFAAKVEDQTAEAAPIRLQGLEYRGRDRPERVSTKARRDQNNPCVLGIRRDGFMSKLDEIDDVRSHDRPSFSRCVGELGPVVQLDVTDLLSRGRVYAMLSKQCSDDRRQILVEIDLHRVKCTSPGYCLSMLSGVSAAFASILA